MTREFQQAFEQALVLDPEHAVARRALGYVLYEGIWMTADEVMRAKGYVLYKGEWMAPLTREVLVAIAKVSLPPAAKKPKAASQPEGLLFARSHHFDAHRRLADRDGGVIVVGAVRRAVARGGDRDGSDEARSGDPSRRRGHSASGA